MMHLRKSRIALLNMLYLFCIVLYAGSATKFARSLGDISTIGNAFALALTAIYIYLNKIKFNRWYVASIIVFSCYALATFINNRHISPIWFGQWIIWLTIAFCICTVFGRNLFRSYEKIIFILCLISLPFWIMLCILPAYTTSTIQSLTFLEPYAEDCNVGGNILIYTVPPLDYTAGKFELTQRNAGFAWEPGAFASFICLAIFCNILRTNFRVKRNAPLFIFLVTLLSTQSTTGLVILSCMILFWLVLQKRIWPFIIAVPAIILIANLPFVKDKILEEIEFSRNLDVELLTNSKFALGRIKSLELDLMEFLRHPVLGLGGYTGGTWLNQQGLDNIATISGIGKLLSMYGAIMTIVFLCMLTLSSSSISQLYSNRNGYIMIVVMIGIMISYGLWTHPLFISFWLYCFYSRVNKQRHEGIDSDRRAISERDGSHQTD